MERKLFYNNLKSFLKELIIVFPENDDELQILSTSINLAIIDDDGDEIIDKFDEILSPLHKEIQQRDNSFFKKVNWDPSSNEYALYQKIRDQWKTFSENNKTVIWDYISLLYTLACSLKQNKINSFTSKR